MAHRLAHRGQVHDGGDAGEILQQHASGHEGDFFFRGAGGARWIPARERMNIFGENELAVFVAQ